MQSQGIPLCQQTPEHNTDVAAPVMPEPEPRHSELIYWASQGYTGAGSAAFEEYIAIYPLLQE